MRRTVREFRFCWRDQIFEVGVSIGLVPIDADSGDLAHVLSAADAACYVAKDSGRNRVHEYELDDTLVAERYGEMQWIHRIHRSFEDKRFRLFYQLIQPLGGEERPRATSSARSSSACSTAERQGDRARRPSSPPPSATT